jgi:hypothetical protein
LPGSTPVSRREEFANSIDCDSHPDADKHRILAFCVASTSQPKLGEGETAYDLALAQTGGNVAAYWRPARDV